MNMDNTLQDNITTDNNQLSNNLQSIFDTFDTINDSLTLFKSQISSLQVQIKSVEKSVKKELKNIKKTNKTKVKSKKAPSGFAKPTKVTKELCEFMNKPEGTEIARTEVTKFLVQYIKSNNLQEQNGQSKNKIIPDEKLQSLLSLKSQEADELNFFTIQKYMNKHFISNKNSNNKII
jgi:chromatin remodeling complex protein RSC6